MLCLIMGCNSGSWDDSSLHVVESDGAYTEFFSLTWDEQRQLFKTYPVDKQIEVYLASRNYIAPNAHHLAPVLAANGAPIVPRLVDRLERTTVDGEIEDLVQVFYELQVSRQYPVADDAGLMETLERRIQSISSWMSRKGAMAWLPRIRRMAELQRSRPARVRQSSRSPEPEGQSP